jgi:hypothetical protein
LEHENNEDTNGKNLDDTLIVVKDTIRHVAMAVTVTEVVEKLGLVHEPETHVSIQPLLLSYARFIASLLHDVLLLLRKVCTVHESDGIRNLADDLLFRLCRTTIGLEFLKHYVENGEQEEVLAISLLRAMNSSHIHGKASFLFGIAAECAQNNNAGKDISLNREPLLKRQRFSTYNSIGN